MKPEKKEPKPAKKKPKAPPAPKHYAENRDITGTLRALGMDPMGRYKK